MSTFNIILSYRVTQLIRAFLRNINVYSTAYLPTIVGLNYTLVRVSMDTELNASIITVLWNM